MTLPDLISECEKLDTPHKKSLLNKLQVVLGILKATKGAEHLLATPEPTPEPKPAAAAAKKPSGKSVDPMPEGG